MAEDNSNEPQADPSGLIDARARLALLRRALKFTEQQRIEAREHLRAELKGAAVPLPNELVARLAQLHSRDFQELIHEHPGWVTWERAESYRLSLQVFERAAQDLLEAVATFEVAVESDIFSPQRRGDLENIERAIQKELFAVTNAAHSLVDHTRRLQKVVGISNYKPKLDECFGRDGLHEFVIGLRVTLHHLHNIEAGWRIENSLHSGRKAGFTINRDQTHSVMARKADKYANYSRICEYIQSSPEAIDLKSAFGQYQTRVSQFHDWYRQALAADALVALRDCERCLKENKNFSSRTFWKAMLGNWLNWKQPPNPYEHLHRFLTADQISEAYALPMQSEQQVDKIIEFMDTDHACDTGLRTMAYQFFRRATPPALPQVK